MKMSNSAIGDHRKSEVALISFLSMLNNQDLESIKSIIHSVYTEVKL